MTRSLTRRLFIAAACALPLARTARAATPVARWQGQAFGAHAEILFAGLSAEEARPLTLAVEAELARLEALFSLYQPDSALARLNRHGRLDAPPPELVELIGLAAAAHELTEGLFDPSVQPLFDLTAHHAVAGTAPDAGEIDAARALVGFQHLRWSTQRIAFDRPGMALTFNGIAQGYATDRIARLLKQAGLTDLMVDIGETALSGHAPDRAGWEVILPDGRARLRSDIAVATSAVRGTLVDPARGIGHLFRPDGAKVEGVAQAVSVFDRRAAMADALSTAAALMSGPERAALSHAGVELVAAT